MRGARIRPHGVAETGREAPASVAGLVARRAATEGAKVYLSSAETRRSVTYGELEQTTARWQALLRDLKVATGQTVGLCIKDPLDFALAYLGSLGAGMVVAPYDPGATAGELCALTERTDPVMVFSDRSAPSGAHGDWVSVAPGGFSLEGTAPAHDSGALEGAVVLTTSGTTGAPKVIRLDETRLVYTATSVARHFELTEADRGYNPLPTFHINAQVVGILATLVAGSTIVLAERFHRSGFWAAMREHEITWINAVPAILARLAPLGPSEHVPAGIRFARSASAPLPVPVLDRFEKSTGICVVETYGMTEAASQITSNPLHGERKPGSAGRPIRTELRVVVSPEDGETTGVGRVLVRGPGVITAYASPGYEARFDDQGWLDTGDLGYLDNDGFLFLVGRADDVINRGGEKIYPKEIEEIVLAVPGVAHAAVVGRDDEVLGQVPVCYIVASEARDETAQARLVSVVEDRCEQRLSRPRRPVTYHVVDAIPSGTNGKVRRHLLSGVAPRYSLSAR